LKRPGVSCIIPAYNEAPRIANTLRAAAGHPLLDEVLVVDDGSTDETLQVARRFKGVRVFSMPGNQGKSRAMWQGLRRSKGGIVLFLDADLQGLRREDISALLAPVLQHTASMSLSLKANAYPLERFFGLEFITGERCLHRSLLGDIEVLAGLEPWAIETHINRKAVAAKLPIRVVPWAGVTHARKTQKFGGLIAGWLGDLAAWRQIIRYQGWIGVILIFWRMWRLKRAAS
jgi:glycosyltransferase involved in cell wall biosynthesis